MFEYKIDKLLNRILSFELYSIFRYKCGLLKSWTKSLGEHYAPYIHKNDKYKKCNYIVFRDSVETGANYFSFIRGYIFAAEWAEENGYIPVADIEHEDCFANGRIGDDNQFEFCFENILPVSEVYENENAFIYAINTTLSSKKLCYQLSVEKGKPDIVLYEEPDWRTYYSNVGKYVNKWIILTKDFKEYLSREVYSVLPDSKCLGVSIREIFHEDFQDFIDNENSLRLFSKHPKAVGIDAVIEIVKGRMEEWGYTKLVLATQCQDTLDKFISEFGENVYYIKRKRKTQTEMLGIWNTTGIELSVDEKGTADEMERVRSYTGETLLLAKCDSLIATRSGGSVMAMAFNAGNYRNAYFFDDLNGTNMYK